MKLAARMGGVLGLARRMCVRRLFTVAVASVLALGGAAGLLSYAGREGAQAQVWAGYYNSAHNTSDLPGFRLSLQYNLVAPNSADLATVYGSPASPTATAPSARITTLARSLENDPDRIYQFVRNTILFEPQFGLHKGADGVLLDGSGGSFDQSQLMVELLRASGYSARYVLGTVNLSGVDAKSILRADTGRQACILLATAGTPASINGGTTACANLGAPLNDVQMLHVWVEAQIGGSWYAFDPSLKTNNRITGVNLWTAAGTTASSAWSNVTSGVTISGDNLNGVNAANIQNDVAGYASTLQNNLIANHSEKSLRELAGGWEIVRTEAPLRNATLPTQAGVSTRWTGDVPAPYRATLRIQTAGFDHTFDLPSIYGWRTQAQIQGRVLRVAVRNQEHLDASATAYFGEVFGPTQQCDGVNIVCGSDPGQTAFNAQARRLDLTINHPYAARRTGNPTPALGTFGDETVSKTIQIGKRADILVRTAGGNGGRKAAWAAANDPIQQHRIIPAGDDYNNCYAMDDGTPIQAGECDGQSAPNWQYWVPDSPHGNGPFAYGEVAVAEMGTKKDALLNGWTDLFDRTVAVLEPLSGARIFHQHSIGVALTTGDNVLDIDTSVGIAANGTDQPHHILSALSSLALTEEALALGQSATERPMFQGSPIQDTGARRMAIGTGLKVLTAPGATAGLPADVTADTRARIEQYLNKGFSVVATTAGTQNAFLARRNDGSEEAWIMRSQAFETGNPTPLVAFRKGAGDETPNPVDYLGNAESRRIAANVAGSLLGAVDLRMGTLSFSEGTELSMGQGEFPYSLSFSRSYVSTGPVEGDSGLGMGWTHNWESSVSHSTDVGALLPQAETVTAAPMLMAAMIALEAGRADTIQASVVSGIAMDWLQEQAASNVINLSGGGRSARFVRLVDGTWRNPASPTESIVSAGHPNMNATTEINWTLADRSVMAFRDMDNPHSGTNPLGRKGILKTWTFPTGVVITLAYGGHDGTNRPELTSVSNNLGATLTFTHSKNQSWGDNQQCYTNAGLTYPNYPPEYRGATQVCHELASQGGRLTRVQAGPDEINFTHNSFCPQYVNFCAFQLYSAQRPGLRTRTYTYGTPTGALANANYPMDYQQVLTQVDDAGVSTPRARFDWRATGGQVVPYVAEAFDAQDRKTTYYSSTFTYSSAKDATNAVIRQTYDEDGRLATSADAMGRTSRATYDGPGRSETIRTPFGDLTRFAYDLRGNLVERRQEPIANCAAGMSTQHQAWWCQTIIVAAEYTNTTWPTKPTRITQPATAADPQVRHWDLTYNGMGLVATLTGPSVVNGLTGSNAQPVWRTWYDGYGRVNRTQDPTGIESAMTYGGGGLPAFCLRIQTVSSQGSGVSGLTTTQACDAVGNITSVTDPRGNTSTTTWDALRRKTGETGPAGTGIQSQFVYDLNGDQVETKQWDSTAAVWRTTTTVFSATHKPLTVTDPSGDLARTCYDAVDRPVTVIDGERRATHTVYNAAGQPTEIHRFQRAAAGSCNISTELPQNAGFTETRWRRFYYNAGGLQSAEVDARGNWTEQQYDGLGRLAHTFYADGSQAWTAMDERGQAIYRKQRGGSQASLFYDAAGRDFHVREFALGDEAYMFRGRNSRASYDLAGRPVWRDVSSQTTLTTTFDDALRRDIRNYGYDPAGRMTSEQWRPEGAAGISFTTGYGYDAANNRTSIVWPGAWTATYAYDAANRIQTVTFPGTGGSVTLTHDSLSRRTGINRPGAAADTAYTYETDSDLASLSHAFVAGSGPGAVSFSYGHDAAGKTTSIGISQPAFEWMPTLAYARSYGAANVLNQVASEGGVPISFNVDGNMTSDGVNTYTWGYGNRMIGASRSGMTAAYDYDSDDRRTKKTVNGGVTRTLWSGADELAEYDGGGTLIRRFVPDGTGAMDARLATVTPAGDVYWHHVDHQGSVIATSDSAGQTVATASYSPYGEFGGSQTVPPQHSPFGYTGRQFDPETGLYQYRARYYSPRLGQFLSTDPIGTKDDPNLYLYVGLDPVNATDPTGTHRLVRVILNVGRRTVQNRGNVGRAVREEAASIGQDIGTLVGPDSTGLERVEAGVNLVSPIRTDEVRAVSRLRPGPFARRSQPARGPERDFTRQERDTNNQIGREDGCHTCGSTEPGTKSGDFVPDHQPVSGLREAGEPQRLHPQCIDCSRAQGGDVRQERRRRERED